MRPLLYLFIVACVLAGFGGAVGSIVGSGAGRPGLWIGGVIGGLVGAFLAAIVARRRRWIASTRFISTALGAMVGFLVAAIIAVNTLSSPIGPVLSTVLVGIGALVGARGRREAPDAAT